MDNWLTELLSDEFIGNQIDLFNGRINQDTLKNDTNFIKNENGFYHFNRSTGIKTPLNFIGLNSGVLFENEGLIPPQEILNKLQKFSYTFLGAPTNHPTNFTFPNLPNLKILNIHLNRGNFIEIPNIKGLEELTLVHCEFQEIPNIIGLKKLVCFSTFNEIKQGVIIPNIVGLEVLKLINCHKVIKIEHIEGLKKLSYISCSKLKQIPHIIGCETIIK